MQRIVFREWELDVDPEATRAAHAASGPIGTETCTCPDCRNFVAARALGIVYPPEVLSLFAQLGLDPPRETELSPFGAEPDGRHLISGWLHAVGRVVSGPPGRLPAGENGWTVEVKTVADGFDLTFLEEAALAPPPLLAHPLIQIEFLARVPWVLPERDPEAPASADAV